MEQVLCNFLQVARAYLALEAGSEDISVMSEFVCSACREPVKQGATRCPHCRSQLHSWDYYILLGVGVETLIAVYGYLTASWMICWVSGCLAAATFVWLLKEQCIRAGKI